MSTKSDALKLADALDAQVELGGGDLDELASAAGELRRMDAENKALRECATKYLGWLDVQNPAKRLDQDILNPEMIGVNDKTSTVPI